MLRPCFGATFVKRFTLCYQTAVCRVCPLLSVCGVGALWPNGSIDQDETWHAGMPRSWPNCVRWGSRSSLPPKGDSPIQFSAHVYCGQTARWIKMPLGMEIGLGRGHIVLDEDQAPLPKGAQPLNFRPVSWPSGWMDQDATS